MLQKRTWRKRHTKRKEGNGLSKDFARSVAERTTRTHAAAVRVVPRSTLRHGRAASGSCMECGGPNDTKTQICSSCRVKASAATKARRSSRAESGLCIRCGQPSDTDKRHCASCLAKAVALERKRSSERMGSCLCIKCGEPNDTDAQCCRACLSKASNAARKRRADRAASGKCPYCGILPPVPGRVMCEGCARARREWNARTRLT